MKASVVYESIFGNTRQVAEAIAKGLSDRFSVEVVEVSAAGGDTTDVDLLVVGGPTHMLGMTRPTTRRMGVAQAAKQGIAPSSPEVGVREFVGGLAAPRAGNAAAFDTGLGPVGILSGGSAAKGVAKLLGRAGYRLVAEPEQFIITTDTTGHQVLKDGELERARRWGEQLGLAMAAPR